MANFDYSQARLDAQELIEFFGGAGVFVIEGSTGGYDEYGNVESPTGDVTLLGTVTPLIGYKQSEIDGESILRSDNYVFLHSDGLPEIGMTTTIGGDKYRIVDVTKLNSLESINIYTKLQLRK
jgi:hypothetical protein